MTIPMPAWLRAWQQTWYWQMLLLPALTGFGGSLLLQGCLSKGVENIDHACLMAAMNATLLTFFTAWVKGHSVGSTSFAIDGTTIAAAAPMKELADNAVELKARADDMKDKAVMPADAIKAEQALDSATRAVGIQNTVVQQQVAEIKATSV